MTMVPNRPTPEGRVLGEQMARMADHAEEEQAKMFPNQRKRCGTCAFRRGTVPNGCVATLMDAVKCIGENATFFCHEKPHDSAPMEPCMGWLLAVSSTTNFPKFATPWPYSHVDDEDECKSTI